MVIRKLNKSQSSGKNNIGIYWNDIDEKIRNNLENKYPHIDFHKKLNCSRNQLRSDSKKFYPLSYLGENNIEESFFPIKKTENDGGIHINHAFLIKLKKGIYLKRIKKSKNLKDIRNGSWWSLMSFDVTSTKGISNSMKALVLCPEWYVNQKEDWLCGEVETIDCGINCWILAGFPDNYYSNTCSIKGNTEHIQLYIPFSELDKYIKKSKKLFV